MSGSNTTNLHVVQINEIQTQTGFSNATIKGIIDNYVALAAMNEATRKGAESIIEICKGCSDAELTHLSVQYT